MQRTILRISENIAPLDDVDGILLQMKSIRTI